MNKKHLLLLVGTSFVAASGYGLFSHYSPAYLSESDGIEIATNDESISDTSPPVKNLNNSGKEALVQQDKVTTINEVKESTIITNVEKPANAPSINTQNAWQVLDHTPEQFENEFEGEDVDLRFVSVSASQLRTLNVDDKLVIEIPQLSESFQPTIVELENSTSGSRIIRGTYTANTGVDYTITLTAGKEAVYGTIETPHDVFYLRGFGKEGWILSGLDYESLTSDLQANIDTDDIEPNYEEVEYPPKD